MAFYSVFGGGVFTFEVGAERQPFIIHKAPIEHHSTALSAMMNNGRMQESTSGLAKLEDVSPRTFALFAEYIYTGMYRVKQPQVNEQAREYVVICRACDQHTSVKSTFSMLPKTCPDCWSIFVTIEDVIDNDRIVWSHAPRSSEPQSRRRQPAHLRLSAYTYADNPFINTPSSTTTSENAFKNQTYPGLGRSHEVLKQYLATLQPADFPTESVYVHAELYVFAEKYMIDSLRDLCLHKLHRDLCEFKLSSNNVSEIEQLLTFTYDNTSAPKVQDDDFEHFSLVTPGAPAPGNDLRTLVMTFAVANAKKLISFPSFEEMLYSGGELVCDFTKGVARRLID